MNNQDNINSFLDSMDDFENVPAEQAPSTKRKERAVYSRRRMAGRGTDGTATGSGATCSGGNGTAGSPDTACNSAGSRHARTTGTTYGYRGSGCSTRAGNSTTAGTACRRTAADA